MKNFCERKNGPKVPAHIEGLSKKVITGHRKIGVVEFMKIKKNVVLFVLMLSAGLSFSFAQNSNILEIGTNAKTSTYVSLLSKDKCCSDVDVLDLCVNLGQSFSQSDYCVEIYDELSLLNTFTDDYIYGTAVMAVVNLHYGFVQIEYSRWDNEKESIVGWDHLFFIKRNDGGIVCIKFVD